MQTTRRDVNNHLHYTSIAVAVEVLSDSDI